MKLVFLSPFAPQPLYGGAVVRIHHLVRGLSRRHGVVWACRGPAGPDVPCPTVLNHPSLWLQILNPWLVLQLWRAVRRADVLVVSSIISGVHALVVHALCPRVPLVYDAHNVEHVLWRRLGRRGWPLMAAFEWVLCHCAQAVWTVSKTDAARLVRSLRLSPEKVQVVPNGVDVSAVQRPATPRSTLGVLPTEKLILFFGVLNYAPNVQAVHALETEIAPRLEARGVSYRILIAGRGAQPHAAGRIRWLGFVDDLYGLIRAADVVVVPLRSGSGTRLKILEAVACGTPVVSTTLGVEGLEVESVTVADTWDAFVDGILATPRSSTGLSDEFVALFDWDRVVETIRL